VGAQLDSFFLTSLVVEDRVAQPSSPYICIHTHTHTHTHTQESPIAPLALDSRVVSCRVDWSRGEVLQPLLLLLQQHVMHRVVEVAGLRASLVRRRIIRAPCTSMPGCHIESRIHTRRGLWAFERNPKPLTAHAPCRSIFCMRQERR
jgi:hypothetical protein